MSRKTTLTLVDMLMEAAENLTDNSLTGKKLAEQIEKAQALTAVSEQIINLKDQTVRELDTNIKAVKVAASIGLMYKPEGLNLTPLEKPQDDKAKALGYKGNDAKGTTPEGLKYEW